MDMLYWAGEYTKVFLAYVAVMFVWPSVVFRGYLKEKSVTVRFAFCTTVQVVLINTVVICLGLLHILHGWLVALLFYGVFFLSIWKRHRLSPKGKDILRRLKDGTYGPRLFLADRRKEFFAWSRQQVMRFRTKMKGHWLEYITLTVVVIFGTIYFSYGAFQDVAYGTSDMPVHHLWIYELQQGKIFSDGIYPEGMHCFIYAIRVVFGIPIYSSELFLAGIHILVFLVSVYLFLKEAFAWRGSAVFALALFLTVNIVCKDMLASVARLQWTIPQEFGLYTLFLCALFLLRYLKEPLKAHVRENKNVIKYIYTNENLFLFQMAFCASFVVHFYVTMMAFFVCLAVVLVKIVSLFRGKKILYLTAAVACGLMISIAPMAVAYMQGYELQGSLGWALSVMQEKEEETQAESAAEVQENTQQAKAVAGTEIPSVKVEGGQVQTVQKRQESVVKKRVYEIKNKCIQKGNALYEQGYVALYTRQRAIWIIRITIAGILLCVAYKLLTGIWMAICKKKRNYQTWSKMDGNLILILASVFFVMAYEPAAIALPRLIDKVRVCSTLQILICAVMLVPVDVVFGILKETIFKYILPFLVPLGVGGIYAGTQYLGIFHGYLYYNIARYNEAVNVTNDIIKTFPSHSYTIISPTEELYQVIEHGYHEELLLFSQKVMTGLNYTIPTEYLFIYVEKKPIRPMQYHFFEGPEWLANETYTTYFEQTSSQGENLLTGTISAANAKQPIRVYSLLSDSYKDLESREILESRAMEWCKNFQKRFPEDMKVYYEDDKFCCYMVRQNSYRLFQLEES